MRIGLDAMGGDDGLSVTVPGALQGCTHLDDDDRLVLVGDQAAIEAELEKVGTDPRIEIVHASQAIEMAEKPVEALKAKPDSSIVKVTALQKAGQLDASISAGNTGACVAAASMLLGRLRGVARPGIAVIAPTFNGPVALCDVGANVNCRPVHLHQYGLMTSLYMEAVCGKKSPRIGLMSVGEEEGKGNDLVRRTGQLMEDDPYINFIGNVESRDLFTDACDAMICDGFVGNVVLKLIEGMGAQYMKGLMKQFLQAMPELSEKLLDAAKQIREWYDSDEYGGAPLLGVDGIWIICHGASAPAGIGNAVRAAKDFASHKVNQLITERITEE